MRAVVFPGQGSQVVGMGKSLVENFPQARHVFQEVDEALKQNLFRLMTEGPDEELRLTYNAQPALMAVSMALVRALEHELGKSLSQMGDFVAGHSLGEYTAYTATGVLSVAIAAALLRTRGQLMAETLPAGVGGMAALIGMDLPTAEAIVQKVSQPGAVCEIANDNAPGQIVVSGHVKALEFLRTHAADLGIKRLIMLPVSGPFHSSLMTPAAEKMAHVLDAVVVTKMPTLPLVPNVFARTLEVVEEIKPSLVAQINGRVRWTETIQFLKTQGVTEVIEIGSGKVLTGLCKRIDAEISTRNIEGPGDIDQIMGAL